MRACPHLTRDDGSGILDPSYLSTDNRAARENMYWEKELETLERGALERLQLERLGLSLAQAVNAPCYAHVPQLEKLVRKGVSSLEQLR